MNRNGMPNTLQVTPSPESIKKIGNQVENAVNTAKQIAGALTDASNQLTAAAKNIRKNSPAITAAATNFVQTNANSVAPVIGQTNAALLSNLPSPVVKSYMNNAVKGGADVVQQMADAANSAANAITNGLNQLKGGANWVAANVNKVPVAKVNKMINVNGTEAMKAGAKNLNSVANTTIVPNMNLKANFTKNHLNAVKTVANKVANSVKNNATKTRKNRRH